MFGFLAWDIGRNHGYYTRQINAYLDDIGRVDSPGDLMMRIGFSYFDAECSIPPAQLSTSAFPRGGPNHAQQKRAAVRN